MEEVGQVGSDGSVGSVGSVRLAVVGVGNDLMKDDGIGAHLVRALSHEPASPGVEFIEAGNAILGGLDAVSAGADVLLIDAADGGGEPGSVYRFGLDDIDDRRGVSLHEAAIPEAFAIARLGGSRFGKVTVLGVEPAVVEVGTELSPTLKEKLPAILALVRREIARLLE